MEVVINIPESWEKCNNTFLRNCIRIGKVLPNGHGRLIDADALKTAYGLERATKYGNESKEQLEDSYSTMMMYEIADMLDFAPAIIEAEDDEWIKGLEAWKETMTNERDLHK